MRIKDVYNHYKNTAIIFEPDPEYKNDEWFTVFASRFKKYLIWWYGNRELLESLSDSYINGDGAIIETGSIEAYRHNMDSVIDCLLAANSYKYRHLYDLYKTEYNPIWNVDGTETLHITEYGTNTGTETVEASGADELNNSTTTFDSDVFRDTDAGRQEYGRKDTRTPDLKHNIERTETRTRGGNIGVTMTQQLEQAELDWVGAFNFIRTVVSDIASAISYQF